MTIYVCRDGEDIGEWPEAEFRERIFRGEILPTDHYFYEGMVDWALVSSYHVPQKKTVSKAFPPALPRQTAPKENKRKQPDEIGGICAFIALFAPLLNEGLFFLVSLPLIFATFVLSIVAMAKGRIIGGIILLISLVIVGPGSCEFMLNRDKWLHHPEQVAAEARADLDRLNKEKEIETALRENNVVVGMTKSQVLRSWGSPIDRGYTEAGVEWWSYRTVGRVYFLNGVVSEKENH